MIQMEQSNAKDVPGQKLLRGVRARVPRRGKAGARAVPAYHMVDSRRSAVVPCLKTRSCQASCRFGLAITRASSRAAYPGEPARRAASRRETRTRRLFLFAGGGRLLAAGCGGQHQRAFGAAGLQQHAQQDGGSERTHGAMLARRQRMSARRRKSAGRQYSSRFTSSGVLPLSSGGGSRFGGAGMFSR